MSLFWEFLNIHFLQNRKTIEGGKTIEKCKWASFGSFWTSIFCKIEKQLKGDLLDTLIKICEKYVSQSRNNLHKKLVKGGSEPTSFGLADLKKA